MSDDAEPTEIPKLYIKERMKAAKPRITGDVLAERMKTTPPTISRLLNGKRKMTLEWLYAFSKALETPIASLFSQPNDEAGEDPEARLRSALLAFGVDGDDLARAVSSVRVFVDDLDEQSSLARPHDPPGPASPRRGSKPSRKQSQRSDA